MGKARGREVSSVGIDEWRNPRKLPSVKQKNYGLHIPDINSIDWSAGRNIYRHLHDDSDVVLIPVHAAHV
jgi:hypothetical protein